MSAAYQPVSLPNFYDGSSRTFGFPNHGWLAVVSILVLGYTLEPSVPRFNPEVVIPKTGGGCYGRKGSHLPRLHFKTVLETFISYGS
ncbi:hypothetical protein [Limnospira platensis]|uniref:hypothetical protein n=1 Tax=Limnospira platensis TaxID=118562 RepID=UPI0009D979AB|nr:hypothetical protein AP9108_33015 [Arthrospira sp. PCC 9108]